MTQQRSAGFDPEIPLDVSAWLTMATIYALSLFIAWSRLPLERIALFTLLFAAFALLQTHWLTRWSGASLRRKRAITAVQAALVVAILFSTVNGSNYIPILLAILSAQVFFAFSAREAFVWIFMFIALIAGSLSLQRPLTDALLTTALFGGAFLFFGTVTLSFRREQSARQHSDRLLQELETAHSQLRASAARVEELAVAEERARIAREIHDSLGHHLTLLSVELQAAARLLPLDPPRAAGEIDKARAVVADALRDVRQSVSALRASSIGGLHPAEAIPRLIDEFRSATGMVVNFQSAEPPALASLSPAQMITLYHAAQEGLTNVQKHAHASRVDVSLEHLPDSVRLRVADNGVGDRRPAGAARAEPAFGLMGLRERVELLGGRLTAGSVNASGFELCVELPAQAQEAR